MYAENNICADARDKMHKYSVVLVLYSNDLKGQKNIFFYGQGQFINFTLLTFSILVDKFKFISNTKYVNHFRNMDV